MKKTYQISYRIKYNKNQISKPYFCFSRAKTFMQAVNHVVKRYSDHTTEHIIIDRVQWSCGSYFEHTI